MLELNDFYNAGFGWICRQCERELTKGKEKTGRLSRIMSEGEAESKQFSLSTQALAKWADPAERILVCPRCGISEPVDKH
jgi:hypothetical protein